MRKAKRFLAAVVALAISIPTAGVLAPTAAAAPVGQGFTVTASDLDYILKQIKIAEHHVQVQVTTPVGQLTGPCDGLLGTGADQVDSVLIAEGLRTVDGSCNNLQAGQEKFGAADETFPRLTTPTFRAAESSTLFGPDSGPTSYAQKTGNVFDTQPRVISNLIVDQTSSNPAAVAAAGSPVRTQGNGGVVPCDIPPLDQPGCVPAHETLFIPNVTTDVGLSPPYNSLFTIFGQFFDHGLDKVTNGGNGTVFVPLKEDDPLVAGPDHVFGNSDDLPPGLRFMTLTRATWAPGPDGVSGTADDTHEGTNTDSPWVDLSQAYSSHPSHQVFLREYTLVNDKPVATGKLLANADGSMANWADVKKQTAEKLGIQLADTDVNNIPMLAADAYGNFFPGPNGLPQLVTADGLVEGNRTNPVSPPAATRHIDTAFLNDIAHTAGPGSAAAPKTPDADTVAGLSLDTVASGEYDNELLDLHVIAGDGRANENIGLTSIHTVFEHEHNRLTDYMQGVLDANQSLKDAYLATSSTTFSYGERLFQAARFVTEMEYQHLVFEEFARKVQPAINPFNLFAFSSTATNPAIKAEFAHAVYRFGHSMLDDTIPRLNVDGTHNDIELLDGFLNPAAFKDVTPEDVTAAGGDIGQAGAGAIIMGLSDQVGNELDEFVADTLRNNLLGLPLDLASLNMTRARSEGVPSLNNVRKQIFAETNDGQLTPYSNWVDFGLHLKHPESLINFVAAYGQHPTILAESTLTGKRNAARAIVNPELTDVPPADAADFMESTGTWANSGDVSITGLDLVDLWVGGLAENTNLFGGLLGSTFNYVFELQLTQLQDDDRMYYLNRTPGMNLRTQLEGNSFAELVMRNTTATALKADSFGTADCKFELKNIVSPAPNGSFITGAGSIKDDPASECDENRLLILNSGQIKYRPVNSVDPSGINGQAVYNGTAGGDRVVGGNDNDTIRGNEGDDIIDGNGGDDDVLGGAGNDRIVDFGGDDVLKGGPGNDALDGGIGLDLLLGGDGKDLTAGGANTNVHFEGPGDDFVVAGQGADEVDGDSGDDWMEGGEQTDLLQGDSGSLFFDDHNQPGNDIMIGQAGDDDYDMEGGDDIGVAGPGIEKNAGAAGYDWSIGLGDPQAQDADLALPVIGVPLPINQVRDRFNEVEALSGANLNDTLHGDDVIPSQVNGGGFIGCDALDADGVARISGLDVLVPASIRTVDSAPIVAASATNHCPLTGTVWGEGNILLGGGGSDLIEGRGADDIIDGDRYLSVRLSVRAAVDINGNATGAEIGSTDLLEHPAVAGTFGTGTAGKTLQQAVFAGQVDPGQIVTVREILSSNAVGDVDTASFQGPRANYTIVAQPDGRVVVTQLAVTAPQKVSDGIDTLTNIERVKFSDVTVSVAPVATLALSAAFPSTIVGNTSAARVVTLRNTGSVAALVISSRTLSGANAGDFVLGASTCGPTLAAGASCTTSVTFRPTATGVRTADFTVVDNAAGSPHKLALTGTGLAVPDTTAPTVTARTPEAGATAVDPATLGSLGVAGTPGISATFSEAVTPASIVAGTTVTLRVGTGAAGALVPITATLNATNTGVTIAPTGAALANDTVYTVRLSVAGSNGIRDLANNRMVAVAASFTTGPAPTVIAQTPAAGATLVSPSANITAQFSEPMVAAGITAAGSVTLTQTGGAAVPAVVTYVAGTRTVTLNPVANLANNTGYTVTLTGSPTAIRDSVGNPLVTTSWTFTTGSLATVTAQTPTAGATGVARAANIDATFSEAMNASTLNGLTVTVRRGTAAGGALQAAALTFDAATNKITINPGASLLANTVYTVRLLSGITNSAGTPIDPVSWSFTTGPA